MFMYGLNVIHAIACHLDVSIDILDHNLSNYSRWFLDRWYWHVVYIIGSDVFLITADGIL